MRAVIRVGYTDMLVKSVAIAQRLQRDLIEAAPGFYWDSKNVFEIDPRQAESMDLNIRILRNDVAVEVGGERDATDAGDVDALRTTLRRHLSNANGLKLIGGGS